MALVLDDIKYFSIVCSTLNVTRASEIIGISQPALSYSIKRLEKELGTELIIRLKNGVQLTKTGEEFHKRSSELVFHWEQSANILSQGSTDTTGEFSIGIHPSVAIYTLEKLLPQILEVYPKLDFKLIHGLSREMTNKVISWELDFGIVINPIEHPDLVIVELGRDIVTLFKANKSKKKMIYDPALAQSVSILKQIKKSNIKTEGHIHSGNLEVVAKLASSGLAYGLLPSRVAAEYSNLSKVKYAPQFEDRLCLIYRKEKHKNIVSQKILSILRKFNI